MSRGNSLSDELELSSVLGDTRAYLYIVPFGGNYSEPKGKTRVREASGLALGFEAISSSPLSLIHI